MENFVVMHSEKSIKLSICFIFIFIPHVLFSDLLLFGCLVARRLILDRILSLHHCKLISWHVHLPEFWPKSINLIQTNFWWKKKWISRFKDINHRNTLNSTERGSFHLSTINQDPHHDTLKICTYKTNDVQLGRRKSSSSAISPIRMSIHQ